MDVRENCHKVRENEITYTDQDNGGNCGTDFPMAEKVAMGAFDSRDRTTHSLPHGVFVGGRTGRAVRPNG